MCCLQHVANATSGPQPAINLQVYYIHRLRCFRAVGLVSDAPVMFGQFQSTGVLFQLQCYYKL
jgi:hypothetical protein